MRKIDLKFLMGDFRNPVKDQVLLHALCNLKSIPYTPNMGGISAESISPDVVRFANACGLSATPTPDFIECSRNVRSLASRLIERGDFGESELDNEIARIMSAVYSDPGYIESMGPFF